MSRILAGIGLRTFRVPRASGDEPIGFLPFMVAVRVPRASGDEPPGDRREKLSQVCSPRERG